VTISLETLLTEPDHADTHLADVTIFSFAGYGGLNSFSIISICAAIAKAIPGVAGGGTLW
jgi:hypothetical protein